MLQFYIVTFIITSFRITSEALPVRRYPEFEQPEDSITKPVAYPAYALNPIQASNQIIRRSFGSRERKFGSPERNGMKRGLDIGIKVDLPTTTKTSSGLEQLEDVLAKALGLEERFNASECPRCDEEGSVPQIRAKLKVQPAYDCDEWDSKLRICVLERNIGDTVTFYLSAGVSHKPNVTWRKEFHIKDSTQRQEVLIDPENCPENIIIGRRGYELRISPITESDIGYNLFSASVNAHVSSTLSKVYFMIRTVPIDLGFVYVGETIELDIRSFVSLPFQSLTFRWYMEKDGEHGTLPSNMKTSVTGSSIKISELRQEQEGVLACIVYTNLDYLATKKRFLIKDLTKNDYILRSSPDDTLVFKEDMLRERRDHKKFVRSKRETNIADEIEEALKEATTKSSTARSTATNCYECTSDFESEEERYGESFNNAPRTAPNDEYSYQDISENVDQRGDLSHRKDTVEGPTTIEENLSGAAGLDSMKVEDTIRDDHTFQHETGLDSKQQFPEDGQMQNQIRTNGNKQLTATDGIPYNENNLLNFYGESLSPNAGMEQFQKKTAENSYIDTDVQSKDRQNKNLQAMSGSQVARLRQISAEESIAKLISFCYTDYECSGSAICMRTHVKEAGFCKCLPGTRGMGIFCRENIWLSNDLEIEEFHNPDDLTYSSAPIYL